MMKPTLAGVILALSFSACATAGAGDSDMSEKAAARLAEFDRTGEIDSCLPLRSIRTIDALDDRHFLVRTTGRDYYLNETSGRCAGAARSFNRLQYTTSLSQLCRNEIITIVDNSSGFTVGSCGLGDFERLEKKPIE